MYVNIPDMDPMGMDDHQISTNWRSEQLVTTKVSTEHQADRSFGFS